MLLPRVLEGSRSAVQGPRVERQRSREACSNGVSRETRPPRTPWPRLSFLRGEGAGGGGAVWRTVRQSEIRTSHRNTASATMPIRHSARAVGRRSWLVSNFGGARGLVDAYVMRARSACVFGDPRGTSGGGHGCPIGDLTAGCGAVRGCRRLASTACHSTAGTTLRTGQPTGPG